MAQSAVFRPIRAIQNLARFQQILNVLLKNGLGALIDRFNLAPAGNLQATLASLRGGAGSQEPLTLAERLRSALEELGPAYVKLGQVLSTRPDVIPAEYVNELRKLQDRTTSAPFTEIRDVIESELGGPLAQFFLRVEPAPKASASIAQVHFAQLLDGREVVLKVQRPGIDRTILADLQLLRSLAAIVEESAPDLAVFQPKALVDEFARTMQRELDFIQEAGNTDHFRRCFPDNPTITAPAVFWDYTTRRVLTLERFFGTPIDRFDEMDRRGIDRRTLALQATTIFLAEVLEFGFFHADPHPGNVFLLDDGRIGLIDFGLVGRIDRELREALGDISFAIATRDYDQLCRAFVTLGIVNASTDLRPLKRDLMDLIEPNYGKPMKQISVGLIIQDLLVMIMRYQAKLPPELLTLARAIVIQEGTARRLDPDLDLLEAATPFLRKLLTDRINPARLAADAYQTSTEAAALARALPDGLRTLLRKGVQDQLAIRTRHEGLEPLASELDRSSNRVALALIISSLIVGSAMLFTGPSVLAGNLGAAGFSAAVVLGVWLASMILRQGKY